MRLASYLTASSSCWNLFSRLYDFPCFFLPFPLSLQFPSQYPTVQVMTAVTDCESSYPHSCTSPHPATSSSHNHIFLSPGPTHPLTPTVSPLSPLQIENALVSPIPVSLIPSPSAMLDKVGPTSPQHQPTAAPQQSVRSEASHPQPSFLSVLSTHPSHTHTALSQNTHPPTNGSIQPLMKVIIMTAMECRCLPRGCEENPLSLTVFLLDCFSVFVFASQKVFF